MAGADRKALNVILAVLGLEQQDLAEHMGYNKAYVSNVMSGSTHASPAFRRAFGETVASLLFGPLTTNVGERYPAAPLVEIIERRAAQAPSRHQFLADLGLNNQLGNRKFFDGILADRLCCALGIHLEHIYPDHSNLSEVS